MKFIETIKNALFEEEYVEVKTKPKNEKEKVQEEIEEDSKKDKPIAKKVILSRPKRDKNREEIKESEKIAQEYSPKVIDEEKQYDSSKSISTNAVNTTSTRHRSMEYDFDDENELDYRDDFSDDDNISDPAKEEKVIYRNETSKEKHPYGIDESNKNLVQDYGRAYEKKEERAGFKPSPIISPIYGVLDKNYKKEDVVQKGKSKINSYSRDSLNVDDVRNKAYGSVQKEEMHEIKNIENNNKQVVYDDEDDDNLLVDLSKDEVKPLIKEVTMGDALEYFQDLGLEYNVDYVDASKERATGRRVRENYGDEPELFAIENEKVEMRTIPKLDTRVESPKKNANSELDVENNDNLFDLIENMYQEEK